MLQSHLASLLFISLLSCSNLSPDTKKELEKASRDAAKQVKATLEHIDLKHAYIGFEAKPGSSIRMYWKDDKGNILGSLQNLKDYTARQGSTLLYACNGGMYMQHQAPLGWYIENGKTLQQVNTRTGSGNFYMKPRGVFYVLENGLAGVAATETPDDRSSLPAAISFLTQSGPMLISNGLINSQFKAGSTNINVRNGVGILPNGNAYFAMSTYPVSFYDFAMHFKNKGCKNALYLDGFVSRSYCPQEHYTQLDGAFGVMIGVVKR